MDTPWTDSNHTEFQISHQNNGYLTTYIVLYTLAAIVGTIGNFIILCAIRTIKELNNPANMLIFNMAIADFLVCSFTDTFTILGVVLGQGFFSRNMYLCKFIGSICLILCVCSMMNIGFLAINRYIHICHHTYYKKVFTRNMTLVFCVVSWLVGLTLDLPNTVGIIGHYYDLKLHACIWNRLANHTFSILLPTLGIGIPCVCVLCCYIHIFSYVRHSDVRNAMGKMYTPISRRKVKSLEKSITVAKTLFVTFLLFVISWIPYGSIVVFDRSDTLPEWLHGLSTFIAHLNSSLNPLLYAFTNRTFRKYYIQFIKQNLFCHFKHSVTVKKDRNQSTVETSFTNGLLDL